MVDQFENHKYINLETFRKNGRGVKTPVWFARNGDHLYVWTQADSGKAKRIRATNRVKIAPSTVSGEPLGEWLETQASTDSSSDALLHTTRLLKSKYGPQFYLFRLMGKIQKATYTSIKIEA